MTIRLYDQDSMLLDFTATVTGCWEKKGQYIITLDQTAFFPEGGGQGADHGTLGGVKVIDCHEHGGEVEHTVDAPLEVGAVVEGHVDAVRRLDMMQQHSGEHIFSGLVCQLFGYDNVGFHIGSEAVTMDFNGPLTEEDVLPFTDVEQDENIAKMYKIGVVNGMGDGTFAPNAQLTREQAAAMLSRLAAAVGEPLAASEPDFTDKDQIFPYAYEAVGQVQAAGIMQGMGDGTFAPKGSYTREQSILTMDRLFNMVFWDE